MDELNELLRELYEPLPMPAADNGVNHFLNEFSGRVTRTLREAMRKKFLPERTRVVQFVSVLPQDLSLDLPARAIVPKAHDKEETDELLGRFALIVHFNIHNNYSFFTQATEAGMTGGKIQLISHKRLDDRDDSTRHVFQMVYHRMPRPNVSFLKDLPVRSHFVDDCEVDIGGMLKQAKSVKLLEQKISH